MHAALTVSAPLVCRSDGLCTARACRSDAPLGYSSRFDLITTELPPELRSSEALITRKGHPSFELLSCLQLSAHLGDHSILRHMIKKQCVVVPRL